MRLGTLAPILLLALGACGAESGPPPRPDVVVVVIDTLRADELPPYGGAPENAPFIAELAERGLVFENAWSTSSWTAPATASIFTSQHPNEHGVNVGLMVRSPIADQLEVRRIPESLETLPEFFRAHGYGTFAVTDNINVDEPLGFSDGFDRFRYLKGFAESGARKLNEQVLAWRDEILSEERPYFLYLHYMDPHEPYRRHAEWMPEDAPPVPEDRLTDRAAYRSEIRHTDENIRAIFEALGVDDDTVVILTADHGQEFLDHGHTGHKWTLYSELTRVPLIARLGADGPTGRSKANVSNIDLLPTLRQVLDTPPSDSDRGVSLLAAADADSRGERELFAMRTDCYHPTRAREMRSIVKGPYKLIVNDDSGAVQLYDLEKDPGEREDLSGARPAVVKLLREALDDQARRALREGTRQAGEREISEEEARQLEALGYTGDESDG
jgi:arylsulfatase A-like enzyme